MGARAIQAGVGCSALAVWLAAAGAACAQGEAFDRADTLVGKSVEVLNVYRNSDGVTIARLKNDRQLEAAKDALQGALKKYPATFIARVLETVYVGSELRLADRGGRKDWGGVYRYSDKSMFLKYMDDARLFETVFHHELAHGIHLNFRQHFDAQAWLSANPEGFEYTHEVDPRPVTKACLEAGFVRPYATFSVEEDVACLAECLIGDPENFGRGVGRFSRINRKARVLAALYRAVDPVMTVQYFRLQQAEAEREDARSAESESTERRGRPIVVAASSERGAFLANVKAGDRLTLLYRDGDRPRSKTNLTFEPRSPSGVSLCRRRKTREEPDLVALARVPGITREGSFEYTFQEPCAAVLKIEDGCEADRVRFEFEVDRSARP